MSVAVVVPWRGGCAHREGALDWVLARYAERHPDWEVIVAGPPAGPWVKAAAVMPVVANRDVCHDIVVVADADVWSDGLAEAVSAVEGGEPWAIPHRGVFRLTELATRKLLDGIEPEGLETAQRPYLGVEGGGVVVAPREVILAIPLDARFVGWGLSARKTRAGAWRSARCSGRRGEARCPFITSGTHRRSGPRGPAAPGRTGNSGAATYKPQPTRPRCAPC